MKESVESLVDLVQRHPIPSVLLGLGIGYLLFSTSGSGSYSSRMESSRERPLTGTFGNLGNRVREAAQEVGQTVTGTASSLGSQVKETAQEVGQMVTGTTGNIGRQTQDWAATAARRAGDATTAMGEQFGSLSELSGRYPVSSFVFGFGLGYWFASLR